MVEWDEHPRDGAAPASVRVFGLDLAHAQVPEVHRHTGLLKPPLFVPCVGNFRRGTPVTIPLHRGWLRPART